MKQQCKQQSENHHQNRPHSALRLLQPFSSQNTGPFAKCSEASLRFPRVLTPSSHLLWVEHVSSSALISVLRDIPRFHCSQITLPPCITFCSHYQNIQLSPHPDVGTELRFCIYSDLSKRLVSCPKTEYIFHVHMYIFYQAVPFT